MKITIKSDYEEILESKEAQESPFTYPMSLHEKYAGKTIESEEVKVKLSSSERVVTNYVPKGEESYNFIPSYAVVKDLGTLLYGGI